MKENSKFKIDQKLVVFYVFLIIVSLAVLGYKIKNTQECPEIKFEISDNTIEVGEIVQFYNKTVNTKSVKWDFGDNSVQVNEKNPAHTFLHAGEYTLTITINNACTQMQKIIVSPKKKLINNDLIPKFTCPTTVTLGKGVNFICLTKGAQKWEWRFGETGKVDSKLQHPSYMYNTPGAKTISLILNDNYTYIAKRIIYVMAPELPKNISKPELAKPAAKAENAVIPQSPDDYSLYDQMKTVQTIDQEKEKIMSNDELSAAIVNYGRNKFKRSQFNPSFCGKIETTTIEANGKLTNFPEFLEKIKGQSLTITNIRTIRESNGCISQIIMKYKK